MSSLIFGFCTTCPFLMYGPVFTSAGCRGISRQFEGNEIVVLQLTQKIIMWHWMQFPQESYF